MLGRSSSLRMTYFWNLLKPQQGRPQNLDNIEHMFYIQDREILSSGHLTLFKLFSVLLGDTTYRWELR